MAHHHEGELVGGNGFAGHQRLQKGVGTIVAVLGTRRQWNG
jgi:hypothetical protein